MNKSRHIWNKGHRVYDSNERQWNCRLCQARLVSVKRPRDKVMIHYNGGRFTCEEMGIARILHS